MMGNTELIVFDLDGTLLDVREGFYWQFQELTKMYDGRPVSKKLINLAAHGTTEQIIRKLVRNTTVPIAEILAAHQILRVQSYNQYLKLYAGVETMLSYLTNQGIKIVALTAGNFLTVSCLDRMQIRNYFHTIVTADHVSQPKPHPEGLLLILKELGVAPYNAIMIGDTVADIAAGKKAQFRKSIGILHGFGSYDDLSNAGADHITPDIRSIYKLVD